MVILQQYVKNKMVPLIFVSAIYFFSVSAWFCYVTSHMTISFQLTIYLMPLL